MESFISTIELYVDLLWYKNISLLCTLQMLYILLLVLYSSGDAMKRTPA